jgi:hypothetical protein
VPSKVSPITASNWLSHRPNPPDGRHCRLGLSSVPEWSEDLTETSKWAIPPNSVDLIAASDLNMLRGTGIASDGPWRS